MRFSLIGYILNSVLSRREYLYGEGTRHNPRLFPPKRQLKSMASRNRKNVPWVKDSYKKYSGPYLEGALVILSGIGKSQMFSCSIFN